VNPQILDAGYNFDFVDDRAIESVGVPDPMLIVPGAERVPGATLRKVRAYRQKGGIVVATRRLPFACAGRWMAIKRLRVKISLGLFTREDERRWQGSLDCSPPTLLRSGDRFTHRKLNDGDLYFVANTSNHAVHTQASARVRAWSRSGGIRSRRKSRRGDAARRKDCLDHWHRMNRAF